MRILTLQCRPDGAHAARAIAARYPGSVVEVRTGPQDPFPEPADGSSDFVLAQTAPWPAGEAPWADALVEAAAPGVLAVAVAGGEAEPGAFAAHVEEWAGLGQADAEDDIVTRVQEAFSQRDTTDAWIARLARFRVPAVAAHVSDWRAIGGFADEPHGVGSVEDLAARALARGRRLVAVPVPRDAGSEPAAVFEDPVLGPFLAIRARLRTMVRALDGRTRGRAVAAAVAAALGEAWRASGIDTTRLVFGGAWGRRSLLRARRVAAARAAGLWPADEVRTLVPLLAVDSVSDWIVGAASELAGVRPQPPAPRQETHTPDPPASRSADPPIRRSADLLIRRSPDPPFVSVIIVSWNGREHLEPCLASLEASTLPRDRFEVVLVDNGSRDGSVEFVRGRFPAVRVVALDENRGFTGGNVAGVEAARGDVFVFLNNDMRVEPAFLERLTGALDEAHPCAAARVLSWDGRRLDFVAGTMSFEGRGYQLHYGASVRRDLSEITTTFFPNGGAFAITRDAYERAGGFDAALFAYYDDIDLGWGVRASGGDIALVPEAVAYHRHGATSSRQPAGQKLFLLERNSLVTTLKRYEGATLDAVLPVMLLLRVRQVLDAAVLDASHPAARRLAAHSRRVSSHGRPAGEGGAVRHEGAAPATAPASGFLRDFPVERWAAVGAALDMLPHVAAERARLARWRAVPDEELVTCFGATFEPASPRHAWHLAQKSLLRTFGADRALHQRPGVLIVTHEPLQARMSGPGIRALELARALSRTANVVLATPYRPEIDDPHVRFWQYDPQRPNSLRRIADRCGLFVVQGFTLLQFPFLADTGTLIVDLYCPFTVEHLEMHASRLASGEEAPRPVIDEAASLLSIQNAQLAAGDFFLCASERQRDFWLGALHTAGRVNPGTYTDDPTLRRLIDVVPFGVPDEPVQAQMARRGLEPAIKGRLPGVPADAFVLLWGGSILDWQDPETLIAAVGRVAVTHPQVRLVFMGTRHPNPQVAPMQAVERSRALAASLGLEGRHVIFNEWVEYDARAAWLADADLGVSTHGDHLETRLSFRTRMLDYLWAGLPIVCSDGDWFAELVARDGLGLVVPPGDVEALAAALRRIIDDEALRRESARRSREAGEALRWSVVARPLVDFVAAARPAADRARIARERKRLAAGGYGLVKSLKRTARAVGVSEQTIEWLKDTMPGRTLMRWQHRRAHERAKRQMERGTP